MRDVTLSRLAQLGAGAAEAEDTFSMDEDAFRLFYERTARPVWAYLSRMTGDPRLAGDLLQEASYRLLRSRTVPDSDDHRRNYLFRIATNLAHDVHRRPRADSRRMADVARPAGRGGRGRGGPPRGEGTASRSRGIRDPTAIRQRARRVGSICPARWRSSSRASGICCGWGTGAGPHTTKKA